MHCRSRGAFRPWISLREHVPPPRKPRPAPRKAPAPGGSGADAIGDFLRSREGKELQEKVARGIFGMLRKRL